MIWIAQKFEIFIYDEKAYESLNKLFLQFKGKNVSVDLRDDNHSEGKVIAVDNYLNLVLETENGLETIKGGNVVLVSLKD